MDENRVLVSRETFGTYPSEAQMLTLYDAILVVNDKVECLRNERKGGPWATLGVIIGSALFGFWCWLKEKSKG